METFKEIKVRKVIRRDKRGSLEKPISIRKEENRFFKALKRLLVVFWALALTLALFIVLPLLQTIGHSPITDMVVQSIDTATLEPPAPPSIEEVKEEEKQEEKPPELTETAEPLDLSQLELALNPGAGLSDEWMGGDFAVKLNTVAAATASGSVDDLFSLADLDQQPRVIYQPAPVQNAQTRKKAPGTVYVIFFVDENGRVQNPTIQKSSDAVFEAAALAAVKQWKFEPGKRNGKAVRSRMRAPVSFPKG